MNGDNGKGKGKAEFQTSVDWVFPDVPSVQYRTRGSPETPSRDMPEEEENDSGVRDRAGEAQGWARSSSLFSKAREAARNHEPSILRSQEPPRKLPKCQVCSEGKEVLCERGVLYSGAPIYRAGEHNRVEEDDRSSESGTDETSVGDSGDWWGEELSGSDSSFDSDLDELEESRARERTAMCTRVDQIRDSIRLGPQPDLNNLWRDQHRENYLGGEPDTQGVIHKTSGSLSEPKRGP